MNALLRQLSPLAWIAAQEAARCLLQGSIDRDADREAYRNAVNKLALLLDDERDLAEIVRAAAQWQMLDAIAVTMAGLPVECAA